MSRESPPLSSESGSGTPAPLAFPPDTGDGEGRDLRSAVASTSPLSDYRRQLEAVCNNATVSLFIMDERQQCVYMNPAAERLTGYTLAEVQGRALHDVVHHTRPDGSHYPLSDCPIDQAYPQNNQEQGEETFVHKDGHFYCVAYTASPIREDGRPIGTVIEVRDLTEQKRAHDDLRAQKALLNAVLEAAPAGIIVADTQGKLLRMNPANDRLWGFPPYSSSVDEYREWNGWWADGSERHGRLLAPEEWALARAIRGETAPGDLVEIEPFDAPGTRKLMLNCGAPVRDSTGKILGGVIAQMDITELRKAEVALQNAHHQLQQRVEELARSNADLEQFAYVASHDLQEPLRTIASYTQLLARRYVGELDPKADKWINYIVDGASRMQRLIEDLLAYSRVGTHGEALEAVESESALHTAISNLASAIADAAATVTHDPLPVVRADAPQFVQLLQNLIGNAIKFLGAEPPEIHVSVRREGAEWLFCVCDNGIGIEAEYVERVFVIFQRLHSRTEYPGTGMGLAICKRIIERHGGRIWVDPQPGPGTRIWFSIPV